MNCEQCKKEAGTLVLLPASMPDGALCILVCTDCALKSKKYCTKHESPHIGFQCSEQTACIKCINEMVVDNWEDADKIYQQLTENISSADREILNEAVKMSSQLTGSSDAVVFLRFVATFAQRYNMSIFSAAHIIKKSSSTRELLPHMYPLE